LNRGQLKQDSNYLDPS